ncbi:6705_t:CDS:2, partial [Gigaspora rosea]
VSSWAIMRKILVNKREKVIANTLRDYVVLYEKCWSSNSDERQAVDEKDLLANDDYIKAIEGALDDSKSVEEQRKALNQ